MTYKQAMTLYRHAQKREEQRMRFEVHLHGMTMQDEADTPLSKTRQTVEVPQDFAFGDPSSYDGLSKEEKQKLTERMMGMHQKWSKGLPFKEAPL